MDLKKDYLGIFEEILSWHNIVVVIKKIEFLKIRNLFRLVSPKIYF